MFLIDRDGGTNTVEYTRLAGIAEIPEGEMRTYDTAAGRVAVTHVEHRLFAFGDECTHAGCSLAEGTFDEREVTVECPCHGSVFDVETGEPVDGPARDPVPIFRARLTDDGWVEIATTAQVGGGEA